MILPNGMEVVAGGASPLKKIQLKEDESIREFMAACCFIYDNLDKIECVKHEYNSKYAAGNEYAMYFKDFPNAVGRGKTIVDAMAGLANAIWRLRAELQGKDWHTKCR